MSYMHFRIKSQPCHFYHSLLRPTQPTLCYTYQLTASAFTSSDKLKHTDTILISPSLSLCEICCQDCSLKGPLNSFLITLPVIVRFLPPAYHSFLLTALSSNHPHHYLQVISMGGKQFLTLQKNNRIP